MGVKMIRPQLIGKFGDNETDERSETELVCHVSVPLCINGDGEARVSVFKSTNITNRGGVVIRLTMDEQDSGFQPFSKNLNNGVELHIAGEIEANSFITALKAAITSL
jgi:hypothetical protein